MTSTRRLLLATSLACAIAPQASMASLTDFMSRHAVSLEQLDGGRPLDARGLGFSSVSLLDNGSILFEGATLSASDGRILAANELTVSDAGIVLRKAVLSRDAENQAFSKVMIDSALIEGPDASRIIMMHPAEICAAPQGPAAGRARIEASGIRIAAPSIGSQAGMRGTEELSISTLELGLGWMEDGCTSFDFLHMRSLLSETPEGDSMKIGGISATLDPAGEGHRRLDLSVSDAAFRAKAGEGETGVRDIRLRLELPEAVLAGAGGAGGVDWSDAASSIGTLLRSNASLSLALTGLELPVGELLPLPVLDKLKLDRSSRYGGAVSLNLKAAEGGLSYAHDVRLSGLANSAAGLEIEFDPKALAAQGAMGLLGLASAANLVSASLSHEDLGLGDAVLAATGRDLDTIIREAVGRLPAPAPAKAPIADWLAATFTGSGAAEARPTHPVPFMQIGMSIAMAPGSLVNILNISTSE